MPFICQYIKLFRVGVYLFTILPCIGQDTDYKESHNTDRSALYSTHSVHITTHYGFIWKHSPRMAHLADSRPFAVELSLHKQTTGRKAWHKLYNYPEIGYSFLYFNLRNPKVLGDAYAIVCYLNVPLYLTPSSSPPRFVHSLLQDSPEGEESGVRSRKGRLYFRIGTGLVYHTNRYDSLENPTNNLFSTSINGVMQSKIEYDKKVSDNISFQAGLMITHFSNGAIKLPNLGINIPTVNVGIRYSPKLNMTKHDPGTVYPVVPVTRDYPTGDINPQKPQQKKSGDMYRYPYLDKKLKLNMTFGLGIKEIYPVGGRKYLAAIFSVYATKNISPINKLCAGIDGFYDSSLKQEIIKDSVNLNNKTPDIKRAGVIIGHELVVGKMSLVIHFGGYVYKPYKKHRSTYQRYGLKYQFYKNFFAGLYLKAHLGSADFIEWSVGVTI